MYTFSKLGFKITGLLTNTGVFYFSGEILLLPSFQTIMFEKLESLYWKIM